MRDKDELKEKINELIQKCFDQGYDTFNSLQLLEWLHNETEMKRESFEQVYDILREIDFYDAPVVETMF